MQCFSAKPFILSNTHCFALLIPFQSPCTKFFPTSISFPIPFASPVTIELINCGIFESNCGIAFTIPVDAIGGETAKNYLLGEQQIKKGGREMDVEKTFFLYGDNVDYDGPLQYNWDEKVGPSGHSYCQISNY